MRKYLIILSFLTLNCFPKSSVQRIIYSDFESDTVGDYLKPWRRSMLNMEGLATDANNQIASGDPTNGKYWDIHFTTTENGNAGPLVNVHWMLDSLYPVLYLQFDIKYDFDFDFHSYNTNGSDLWTIKTWGGFSYGRLYNIPYDCIDSMNNGGSFANLAYDAGGGQVGHTWYGYTNSPRHPGLTPTAINDRPLTNASGTWWSGYMYTWSNYTAASGGWGGTPNPSFWNGTSWETTSYTIFAPKGSWYTTTLKIIFNHPGKFDGITETYINGVLKFQQKNLNFLRSNWMPNGVSALLLKEFCNAFPVKSQHAKIDNFIVYYYRPNDPNYDTIGKSIGDTITLMHVSGTKYVPTDAKPKSRQFYDANGEIYDHATAFNFMPEKCYAEYIIAPTEASSIRIILDSYSARTSNYDKDYFQLFTWNGTSWVEPTSGGAFIYRRGGVTYGSSLFDHTFSTSKIKIVYNSGTANQAIYQDIGWHLNYTSNGSGSGTTNYIYPTRSQLVAQQYKGVYSNVSVTGVSLNSSSVSLYVAGTTKLTATISPSNATNKIVYWSSNASSQASVNSSGLVTGINPGSAIITATTADGSYTATCNITVLGNTTNIPFDSIKINFTSGSHIAGGNWNDCIFSAQNSTYTLMNQSGSVIYPHVQLKVVSDGFLGDGYTDTPFTGITNNAAKSNWYWYSGQGSGDSTQVLELSGFTPYSINKLDIGAARATQSGYWLQNFNANLKTIQFNVLANSTIYTINNITADINGKITLSIKRLGSYGHVNFLIITPKTYTTKYINFDGRRIPLTE